MIITTHETTVACDDGYDPGYVIYAVDSAAHTQPETVENAPSSLSNTGRKSPDSSTSDDTSAMATDWGIDTVKVSFTVNPAQSWSMSDFWRDRSSRTLRKMGVEAETLVGYLNFEHGDVRVTLYMIRAICHLEFNASRLVQGKSSALWTPDGLVPLVHRFLDEVREHAWPEFIRWTDDGEIVWDADWADQVKIRRLDIARNFLVSDPALVKRALPNVTSRHARMKVQYQNSKGGWTIVNGTSRSGQDRLYDKAAELDASRPEASMHDAGDGLFRFETQLQKERLASHGLTRLSDVTSNTAWKALVGRWEATRWGSPLPTSSGLLEALEGLSGLQAERLLGFLHLDAIGHAEQLQSPSHVKDYRALARSRGLTPGMPVELLG
jgi:hypothetical protein